MSARYVRKIQSLDECHNLPSDAGLVSLYGTLFINSDGTPRMVGAGDDHKTFFVDANAGVNSNDGRSWGTAYLTMAKALTSIGSGDTIRFRGKLKEQVTTPVQVFDVTVIGEGNRPRHADATPTGGATAANTWTIPDSPEAAVPLIKVLQQGWRFLNILFAGPTDAASILLFRDGGAGNAERDASHAEIIGCRFASGFHGIEQSGGCYNVGIFDNKFDDLTGFAIKNTAGAGIAASYRWQILRNRFSKCANWMGAWSGNTFQINDNHISQITTELINLSGGTGFNQVLRNSFNIAAADFDPAGGVTGKAGDVWSNYLTDALETGLPAN